MALEAGTKLGRYEILSPLGAGGMGEVYRARDSRLDRDVAIKVLPSHLTSNSEFKQRFEREAKSISQLSHPNICTLHDIGNEDGVDFLVMELLEGDTLAQCLNKGSGREAVQTFPWIHTFIGNMKRMILGTHHWVSHKHVDDYLAEFTYRANRRWLEANLFGRLIVAALDGKAVTYKELTAGAT